MSRSTRTGTATDPTIWRMVDDMAGALPIAEAQTAASTRHKQHVIDPEICIRCNTCEDTCPVDAVSHDDNNYVVDAEKCNFCLDCISPCPTGSIDNWRIVARSYSLEE